MSQITGRYGFVAQDDNYGEYLKAIGVGMIQRTIEEKAKPTIELTEAGGKWTMKTLTALKSTEIVFVLGEEFDETTTDGRQARSTAVRDGGDLVHVSRIGGEESKARMVFTATELKITRSAKGVESMQVYKRLES